MPEPAPGLVEPASTPGAPELPKLAEPASMPGLLGLPELPELPELPGPTERGLPEPELPSAPSRMEWLDPGR